MSSEINPFSGFSSSNLKLAVLDQLMYVPFDPKYGPTPMAPLVARNDRGEYAQRVLGVTPEQFEHIFNHVEDVPGMREQFDAVELTPELLAQVTLLSFDGGNDIYFAICPGWDGEDDRFDCAEITDHDLDLLPNLGTVYEGCPFSQATQDRLEARGIQPD